jgi:hypothetical protein
MIKNFIEFDPKYHRRDGNIDRYFHVTLQKKLDDLPNGKYFFQCSFDNDTGLMKLRNFDNQGYATEEYCVQITFNVDRVFNEGAQYA